MIIFLIVLLSSGIALAQPGVNELIVAGQYSRAVDLLAERYGDSTHSTEYLLLSGMTDQSGENSVNDLKEFINRGSTDSLLVDWARLMVGKYYLAQNLYQTASGVFEEVPQKSLLGAEAAYLAGLCYYYQGEIEGASRIFQNILKKWDSNSLSDRPYICNWAVLGLADCKAATGKYSEAEKYYRKILAEPGLEDDIYAFGLLESARLAEQRGKSDEATSYLKNYKDFYGNLPDGYALEESKTADAAAGKPADDEQLDKILGNKYYIQIGVYSKKSNAESTTAIYKKSGYKTVIEKFSKQGQPFYRVLVGSYGSKSKAEFVKEKLEKSASEKYVLLVR